MPDRLGVPELAPPQRQIAELFQVPVKTANEQLVNIYGEGERCEATIRSFRIVRETLAEVNDVS